MQSLPTIQYSGDLTETDYRYQLAQRAYTLGGYCQDPASAFLAGYQMAIRCVDTELTASQWGAFCINERGIKSLSQLSTVWQQQEQRLSGKKSFALMAGQGLDRVVVIARSRLSKTSSGSQSNIPLDKVQLVAVKIDLPADQVRLVTPPRPAKILPSLPHSSLIFDDCPASPLIDIDNAHTQLNKPFRFWEDVMVTLSFSAWIKKYVDDQHSAALDSLSQQLLKYFAQSSSNYDRRSMALVEQLHQSFCMVEIQLPQKLFADWQRDKQILTLAQPIRDRIKQRLD